MWLSEIARIWFEIGLTLTFETTNISSEGVHPKQYCARNTSVIVVKNKSFTKFRWSPRNFVVRDHKKVKDPRIGGKKGRIK